MTSPLRPGRDPIPAFRERSRSSPDIDSNWLITLSDVLSLLLVFFVVFMVTVRTSGKEDHAKSGSPLPAGPADPDPAELGLNQKIFNDVNDDIRKLALDSDVSVQESGREIRITLKEKIAFEPGRAEILGPSEPILDRIAEIIQKNAGFDVEIDGYTDDRPINTVAYPSNWELSVARSGSVLKYFLSRYPISPTRLSIRGSGDQNPVAPNDSPENRAKNRRVEIRLKEGHF